MKKFFTKFVPFVHSSDTRFGRYYAGIIGTGAGYPTADEARRDLRGFDRNNLSAHWLH